MPSTRIDHPVLVLVSGLPGSGKTTHACAVERRLFAIRLSADDWLEELAIDLWDEDARDRIEQLQWRLAKRLVAVDVSVVIEWGTWSRAERDHIRVEAQRLGARTELHHLAAPSEVLYGRVVRRAVKNLRSVDSRLSNGRRRLKPPLRTRPNAGITSNPSTLAPTGANARRPHPLERLLLGQSPRS